MKLRKVDLRKQLKPLYSPSADEVQVVDVPRMKFLMVDGEGAPGSQSFQEGIQTLYSLAYTTKFGLKKGEGIDYPVMALEGLWWMGKSGDRFDFKARERWQWTLMIMQPEFVSAEKVKAVAGEIRKKGKPLGEFRFDEFHEGLSAQIMHVGPYSAESATIERIQRFIKDNGYQMNGKHHEIYLGDPRRAAPSKLRTILRWPITKRVSR